VTSDACFDLSVPRCEDTFFVDCVIGLVHEGLAPLCERPNVFEARAPRTATSLRLIGRW